MTWSDDPKKIKRMNEHRYRRREIYYDGWQLRRWAHKDTVFIDIPAYEFGLLRRVAPIVHEIDWDSI